MIATTSGGLFEVMDNEEVAQDSLKMRYEENMSTSDAATKICEITLNKGIPPNVGAVHYVLQRLITTEHINDKSRS